MLTIRPSPASRIDVKAARQHRNEPVRLTASVLCQISVVVLAKGAEVSEPAAQTSTAGGPASQSLGSATDRDLHAASRHAPVKPLVCIETELEIEMALRVPAALGARELARPLDGFGRRSDVPLRDQQARHALDEDFLE